MQVPDVLQPPAVDVADRAGAGVQLVERDRSVGERARVDRNAHAHCRELVAAAPHGARRRAMRHLRQVGRNGRNAARVHDDRAARNHPRRRLATPGSSKSACRAPATNCASCVGRAPSSSGRESARCRPPARKPAASTRTARTCARARRRRGRRVGHGWSADRTLGQGVHERFQIARPIDRRHEHGPFSDHHDQPGHAVHDDRRSGAWTTLSRDSTAWTCPCDRVADVVVRPNALEGAPGPDVVPSEIAGQHDHAIAALEHADVDRDRASRRRKSRECRARTRAGPAPLPGCQPPDVVEKIADAPHENPRVPQVAVASHLLGAGAVGLLDEARDSCTPGSSSFPGWM